MAATLLLRLFSYSDLLFQMISGFNRTGEAQRGHYRRSQLPE